MSLSLSLSLKCLPSRTVSIFKIERHAIASPRSSFLRPPPLVQSLHVNLGQVWLV